MQRNGTEAEVASLFADLITFASLFCAWPPRGGNSVFDRKNCKVIRQIFTVQFFEFNSFAAKKLYDIRSMIFRGRGSDSFANPDSFVNPEDKGSQ